MPPHGSGLAVASSSVKSSYSWQSARNAPMTAGVMEDGSAPEARRNASSALSLSWPMGVSSYAPTHS